MRRQSQLVFCFTLLLALLLAGCVQDRADELEPGAESQATGEVVVGEEPSSETGVDATGGVTTTEAMTPTDGMTTTDGITSTTGITTTEGTEGGVSSGGGIGDAAGSGEGATAPSTPAAGEVTTDTVGAPATEATTVAVEGQPMPEATPAAGDAGVAATGEEPAAPTAEETTYTVQAGDTLFSIATSFGTTTDDLSARNGLTSGFITVGQVLKVPAAPTTDATQGGAAPAAGGTVTHTVQGGEWLYSIARQYNVSPEDLMRANNLTPATSTIYPGQQLVIPAGGSAPAESAPAPAPTGRTHTVVPGDALYNIARQYGTTVDAIKAANGLTNNTIYAGQVLTIP